MVFGEWTKRCLQLATWTKPHPLNPRELQNVLRNSDRRHNLGFRRVWLGFPPCNCPLASPLNTALALPKGVFSWQQHKRCFQLATCTVLLKLLRNDGLILIWITRRFSRRFPSRCVFGSDELQRWWGWLRMLASIQSMNKKNDELHGEKKWFYA